MQQRRIIDYKDMWTNNANCYALLQVDQGYIIYDKLARRALMLEPHISQYIINHMLHANVEIWEDSAAAS